MAERKEIQAESPNGAARPAVRICLAAILAVALLVRLAGLGRIPPPLFRDEAEKGYNAWCLAKTGRDYDGRRLPLFINAFGTHTSAMYQYASAPFVALFGLKVWSIRLAAAFAGVATVLLLYMLARALFDPPTALVAAAVLALSPWHICFSRWAQQGIFLPLLFTAAAWGVVRFRQGWRWGLPIAAAAIALAAYAYAVGRALAPLMLILLLLAARRELRQHRAWAVAAAIVLGVLVAPTLWFVAHQSDEAMGRFRRVSIAQPGRHPAEVVGQFLVNYARHFDPVYLAVRGDQTPRHSPAGVGQIYPVELLLLLAGVYFLARRRDTASAIVLGWIAIAPVAASMTQEGIPHSLRSLAGVPAFALLAAVGLVEGARRLRGNTRTTAILLLAGAELACAANFLYTYTTRYPQESAQAWQAGLAEALDYCRSEAGPTDTVWISGTVGMHSAVFGFVSPGEVTTAFCAQIEPEQFQRSRLRETRWSILPRETRVNLLLTRAKPPPTFTLAFVGEMGERKPIAVFAGEPQPELAVGVYRF